jgi:short-subunit dehydrogenase
MSKRTQPARALVTGASGGLGAALSRRLASRGIEVWLAARREALLREQAQRIEREGGRAHVLALDIASVDETHDRFARLDEEVGGIDLVIANAAIAGLPAAVLATVSDCGHPSCSTTIFV